MSEKILNTRLQLKTDTTENWTTNSSFVLKRGEAGIEITSDGKQLIKIGDGTKTWEQLSYSSVTADEILKMISDNEDNVYVAIAQKEEEDLDALGKVATTPKKGDIGIVKRTFATDKVSHTAYVYNGSQWEVADGNYNADNVYFDSDLTITAQVGVQKPDASGSKTLATTGKNVKQVLDLLFAEEKNPSITQPSVTVSSTSMGAKEVGTNVTPNYSAVLNAGKYEFGPATGITAKTWAVTDNKGGSADTATGNFAQLQVEDDTNYSITAVATYDEGTIPKTNLGNEYPTGKIVAGSKTGTKGSITGYRNSFYGTLTNKDVIDGAVVRGLTGKSNKALRKGDAFTFAVPVGALRVVIAYPATLGDIKSVLDVNGLNAEIKSGFTKQEVQVEGANGYKAIAYNVYNLDFAKANDAANTYKVTI